MKSRFIPIALALILFCTSRPIWPAALNVSSFPFRPYAIKRHREVVALETLSGCDLNANGHVDEAVACPPSTSHVF